MRQYNVDFFDHSLNNIHHDTIADLSLDDDYLSPSTNTITIAPTSAVTKHCILYIQSTIIDDSYFYKLSQSAVTEESEIETAEVSDTYILGVFKYIGVVTEINDKDYYTEITFEPFTSYFSQNILFDTTKQNSKTTYLEQTIRDYIYQYWAQGKIASNDTSGDSEQKFPALTLSYKNAVTNWTFSIDPEDAEATSKVASVSFYETILAKALSKYRVSLTPTIDFANKKINVNVERLSTGSIYIDADSDNITIESFSVNEFDSATNKLVIFNADNISKYITYYLHVDKSYDTTNDNRLTPVKWDVVTAKEETDSNNTVTKSFEDAAKEKADSTFSGIEWTNLIELTMSAVDRLVNPLALNIGQEAKIVHNNTVYTSLLTGKKVNEDDITLVFGTIRHDLTKKLK